MKQVKNKMRDQGEAAKKAKPQKGAKRASKKLYYQMYRNRMLENTNRQRRMRRHLRAHPDDIDGARHYAKVFGPLRDDLTCQGRRRQRRAAQRQRYVGEW